MKTLPLAAIALAALTTAAAAHESFQNRIDQREARQEQRIQRGVQSGQITHREYRQLESAQGRIRSLERQARRDGHIDRYEAAQINRAQNAADRRIWREKHDADRRRWW